MPNRLLRTSCTASNPCAGMPGSPAHIKKVAGEFQLDPIELCKELFKYKPIGTQEDLIIESALTMKAQQQGAL
ncbi:hypothetical protein GKC30_12645 [Pseudodesulfovibrio sp. F-1]|uniref:DmpG-like communication domain-containing protein n=2 Tax=Pseudodesulfovibrio alkaliphilus TaxID=2661613 RepID=A0A7K1KQW8_9BACT|nr:hypothetical protein [Pseudodesulfovibrio alkaliphilus]